MKIELYSYNKKEGKRKTKSDFLCLMEIMGKIQKYCIFWNFFVKFSNFKYFDDN